MKKLFLPILALTLTLLSCKELKPVNYILFSGIIKNSNSHRILIVDDSKKVIKAIRTSKEGVFSDTIFNANGRFKFINGAKNTFIYLKNGYNIKVNIDAEEFENTIFYSGKGSSVNNYLAKKARLSGTQKGREKLYSLEETDFLFALNQQKKETEKLLDNCEDKAFLKIEKVNIYYENLSNINTYNPLHMYFAKDPNFKLSKTYPKPFKDFDYNNDKLFKTSWAYKEIILNAFTSSASKKSRKEKIPYETSAIDFIKNVKSQLIKNHLLTSIAKKVEGGNPLAKMLYKDIMALSTDAAFKDKLTEKFKIVQRLRKGQISPKFVNLENSFGGITSLDDFKGKYVYIDVWATWCAPCKKEIPFLKKIEEQYHNKNIVFIGISVDGKQDHSKWKKMILDKNMNGVQLFTGKGWKTSFVSDYNIKGIPRFILLDPNGNIVSADAPRPSDEKLIELFNEMGI
jgi:thiol-disulfide isomerase/thioredoxin